MFPVITPQILNMPDSVQAASLTRLPWPEGSVIPARPMPTEAPGNALLIIGGYRLLAEVPPNVPMGEVWMQLVHRELPAGLRLLNSTQLLEIIAEMLKERHQEQSSRGTTAARARNADALNQAMARHAAWPSLDHAGDGKTGLPWHGEATADGNTMLWYDDADNQPRGMLRRTVEQQHFTLSGRVDLDELGPIAFDVSGAISENGESAAAWRIDLHTTGEAQQKRLRDDFRLWLERQRERFPDICGEIAQGFTDDTAIGNIEATA